MTQSKHLSVGDPNLKETEQLLYKAQFTLGVRTEGCGNSQVGLGKGLQELMAFEFTSSVDRF